MSVLHSILGPGLGQAGWEAAHTVENGTVTAAMLADSYQPLDSDLTAIAALTTTAYGRAFLALADAAAARTALALGTAATSATGAFDASGSAASAQAAAIAASQPVDSDLTAIAALSTTSFGRGLLTSADAAALRTSAGLGTLATQSGTFSGTSSGTNTGDQTLSDATITTTDITTNNVTTSKHGFTPKLSNVATQYLDGTGAYSVPAGGSAWVLNLDQDGSSFTGWTALSGTWASSGGLIQQTNNSGEYLAVRTGQLLDTSYFIAQVEIRFPTSGQGTPTNFGGIILGMEAAAATGHLNVSLGRNTPGEVRFDSYAAATILNPAATIALDTWYTLRCVVAGPVFASYLNGTLVGTAQGNFQASNHVNSYLGLRAHDAKVDFRNIKVWNPTQP